MARPSPFDSVRSFVGKGGMSITVATLALALVGFVGWWASRNAGAWLELVFFTEGWFSRPWSIVTYAFIEGDFVRLVFSGLMAFFFMGALERAWGRDRFVPAYVLFLIAPPLSVWLGSVAANVDLTAMGLWLPVACWTVAFGAYRPQASILIFGVVPVKAMWIGLFAGLAAVFQYGSGAPVAGLCVGLSMALAWLLGSRRFSLRLPEKKQAPGDEFRKSLKTKRESEQERLRLRELLERSVQDDERE